MRLRFEAAFGLVALSGRPCAGLRNGRAAARRRIIAEIAGRLFAADQRLDLFAGQGLVFEQTFGKGDEFVVLSVRIVRACV